MVVCVSQLLFAFLLLVVKLSTKEGEREDVVLFNCGLLLQLGLVQPTGSVENSLWMLPHGVLLFRRMRRLVYCYCYAAWSTTPLNPIGVCRRAVRRSDKAVM